MTEKDLNQQIDEIFAQTFGIREDDQGTVRDDQPGWRDIDTSKDPPGYDPHGYTASQTAQPQQTEHGYNVQPNRPELETAEEKNPNPHTEFQQRTRDILRGKVLPTEPPSASSKLSWDEQLGNVKPNSDDGKQLSPMMRQARKLEESAKFGEWVDKTKGGTIDPTIDTNPSD